MTTIDIASGMNWITERQNIHRRREAGEPPPWTDDPILRDYRFCNVIREDDAVTRHIARTWREPHADDPSLFYAMAVARFVNWPETLDEIGYPVPRNRDHFKRVLSARMVRGETTFGPAYVIPNGGSTKAKIDYIADDVLDRLWRARAHMSPQPGTTLATYCARLMDFKGVGSFMAGQIIADLKYVEPLRSAPDWKSFVISGPGSKNGLNRIMGRPVDALWTESAWQAAFRRLEAEIRPELLRIGLALPGSAELPVRNRQVSAGQAPRGQAQAAICRWCTSQESCRIEITE
jgi:hypothetical protein